MKIGRKLADKLLNASKFVLALGDAAGRRGAVDRPLDRAMLGPPRRRWSTRPPGRSTRTTTPAALERTEAFFWWFCDDYVELVKSRAYGTQGDDAGRVGARRAARWRWARCTGCSRRSCRSSPTRCGRGGSPARCTAPPGRRGAAERGDAALLEPVSAILTSIRRAKTDAKVSQRAAVEIVAVSGPPAVLAALAAAEGDLRDAGSVVSFSVSDGEQLKCDVVLAMPGGGTPA